MPWGAGDQGIMWGYATNETPNYMPLGMFLARGINQAMRPLDWDVLFADCKTQVTIAYDEENKPIRVSHVVISCLHHPEYSIQYVRSAMENRFLGFVANLVRHNLSYLFDDKLELILNHAGSWTFGGPAADTGVTGRKIVVDAYGADCEVGGGAFSGKDGTKVDRSGAYAARYIAKNIVSAGLAKECKVQLGYVIGQKEPVSFNIDFMNTGLVKGFTEREAEKAIRNLMSLTPGALIERFRLKEPMFQKTAMYGHFGIPSYPWEDTSLAHKLKKQ
jgi:S-adenosylmethionine synthetase